MSTATVSYGWDWEALLRTWQELDVPEGWRAEITEGGITMTPPSGNGRDMIAARIHRVLLDAAEHDWDVFQTLGISVRGIGRLYEPDLVVVPRAELEARSDNDPVPADRAKLVVEIVSKGNARTDRVEKLRAYACAPVPLYLLVDRFDEAGPAVTLFSDPVDGHYRESKQVSFGEPIALPAPVELKLETADFA